MEKRITNWHRTFF